jgi:hypothetical protein
MEMQGKAWQGKERKGKTLIEKENYGMARQRNAIQGKDRHGKERQGLGIGISLGI